MQIEEHDVVYLRHGELKLAARLYRPTCGGHLPGVVNVHGGAWTSGDLLNNEPTSRELAESGCVVMAIDFRMPPIASYPEPVADINFAIRWLKANAATYGVDPNNVGGIGFSSGGHQLTLNALRPRDPRYIRYPLPSSDVDASLAFLVLLYAVLDPVARYAMVQSSQITKLINSHHGYWADEAEMAEGSPQGILERGEPVELPPVLIIQGVVDNNLTPEMADRFGAAYLKAGGRAEVLRYDDAPHGFIRRDASGVAALAAMGRITDFIHHPGA